MKMRCSVPGEVKPGFLNLNGMLTQFRPSREAFIIQCRSAFSLYLRKGLEEVEKRYPESVEFVKQHSNKSLLEVTNILTEQLNTSASSYSGTSIPASAK
jgi:hypothetical protein